MEWTTWTCHYYIYIYKAIANYKWLYMDVCMCLCVCTILGKSRNVKREINIRHYSVLLSSSNAYTHICLCFILLLPLFRSEYMDEWGLLNMRIMVYTIQMNFPSRCYKSGIPLDFSIQSAYYQSTIPNITVSLDFLQQFSRWKDEF